VAPEAAAWLALYAAWKNGVPWQAGGLKDQPALYVQMMHIIDAAVNEITQQKLEEQEKQISQISRRSPKGRW